MNKRSHSAGANSQPNNQSSYSCTSFGPVAAILDVTTGRVSQTNRAAIERAHSLIMEHME
jgi:hypothetical protein